MFTSEVYLIIIYYIWSHYSDPTWCWY